MDETTYNAWQANGPDVTFDLDCLARAANLDDLPAHLQLPVLEAGAEDDLREACDVVAQTIRAVARGDDDAGSPDDLDDLDLDC